MNPTETSLAVAFRQPDLAFRAEALALELDLPLTFPGDHRFTHLLMVTPERLELQTTGPAAPGPVAVDFMAGRMDWRRRHGGGRNQPLGRAVGLKGGTAPRVLDPTAGLGRDGFVLAWLGCRVQLVERSPIIAALLTDALERVERDPELGALVAARLSLIVGDGQQVMRSGFERPEVVYLDPMYPHRTKTALVKKEMRLLRSLVGGDPDAPDLLAAALDCATRRVVVKRPKGAPSLEGPKRSLTIEAKNTRFDIYLIPAG
ncbi:MAG: class I SAM-dependent methyltransferase [Candidatus Competibacteraceae bacterium]|nr:class I SAM-dependent methyltransferase [Candidatus Competibacteraceae bacterium]